MDKPESPIDSTYPSYFEPIDEPVNRPQPNHPDTLTILKHLGLFIVTFATVSLAGAEFVGYQGTMFPASMPDLIDISRGAIFAGLILAFLGVHEFGHYFAAYFHKIRVTLPYFIPIPFGIGTLGAVIRIRQKINHSYEMFDVGAAGPLAGFLIALGVLLYGFMTLPHPSYITSFAGSEPLKQYIRLHGTFPSNPLAPGEQGGTIAVGNTLMYSFLASFFRNVPPMWEMYHYPFLFAGWLGLFFTALNLTPVGQLDGGHILYSLIGFRKHRLVARIFFCILVTLGGIQAIPPIHLLLSSWGWSTAHGLFSLFVWAIILSILLFKAFHGNYKWITPVFIGSLAVTAGYLYLYVGNTVTPGSLIWVVWSFFLAFFTGIEHPPAMHEKPLDLKRKILGWSSMVIYILCISPTPIYLLH
ncbi:MAG TPA: site-2 protease family protein [Balneolaceae bacterium]|nr:site-2 protease family protein [Balneolaceae bacterium]